MGTHLSDVDGSLQPEQALVKQNIQIISYKN